MATADAVRDRQQARDQRGLRSSASAKPGAERLPSPPRERKPALAALAVLLIIGGAAIAGLLAMRMDERTVVLAANQEIPAGTEITDDMITTTKVSSEVSTLVEESLREDLVGNYTTKVAINAGELLDTNNFRQGDAGLEDGMAAVGAHLPPGRAPATRANEAAPLKQGDLVNLVYVKDGQGKSIVKDALVDAVDIPDAGTAAAGGVNLTFIVEEEKAARVAAAAANEELAVVVVPDSDTSEDEE